MRAQRRQYILRSAVCCVGYMAAMHVIDARSRYELPSPSVEQCHAGHASLRARQAAMLLWLDRAMERPFQPPFSAPRSSAREPHRAKSQRPEAEKIRRKRGCIPLHSKAEQTRHHISCAGSTQCFTSLFSFGWHPARKGESEAGTKDTTNGEPILQSTSLD